MTRRVDTGSRTPEDAAAFQRDHAEPEDDDEDTGDGNCDADDDDDESDPPCCNSFDCPCGGYPGGPPVRRYRTYRAR